MYNVEDILARIQKGESPEDIANEFAAVVNAAIDLDKKQKEEALAAAAQKAKEDELNGYINDMTVAMMKYIKAAYPEVADLMDGDDDIIDVNEIRKMLDVSVGAAIASLHLAAALSSTPTPDSKATSTPDDAINQFLKNFGL
jgi:hypothetical protein